MLPLNRRSSCAVKSLRNPRFRQRRQSSISADREHGANNKQSAMIRQISCQAHHGQCHGAHARITDN